jgi:hypothetical protein
MKLALAISVLTLCSLSLAETPSTASANNQPETAAVLAQENAAQAASHSPFATADCSFTFTSGANFTFLKYCVTANGNVTVFQTPEGEEHIAVVKDGEGYGICDLSTNTAYDDYAEFGDSGNWQAPIVLSQTATSVKIARTTSDGVWTLTQTFMQVVGNSPSVRIGMTLRNNSAVSRGAFLLRYVDVDAAGATLNNLDGTFNSAFGWNSIENSGKPFGLMLQNINSGSAGFQFAVAQNTPNPPDPCNPSKNVASGPLLATDGSLFMGYELDNIPKSRSATVTLGYKGF